MGVISRLATLIKSNINDLISKAEDPEKILNQLIHDMREQLIEAKKQVAGSIADAKRLKKKLDKQIELSQEWERKAMLAVRAGRDELAEEALKRKQAADELSEELQKQYLLQQQAADELRGQLRQLNDKIEEAKRKKELLIARKRRAEAQMRIQETMSGFDDTSAFEAFDRMSEKIERIEAEAEATAEMVATTQSADLDARFSELEQESGVSDALAALKQKMGVAPAAASEEAASEEEREELDEEERVFQELEELAAAGDGGRYKDGDY